MLQQCFGLPLSSFSSASIFLPVFPTFDNNESTALAMIHRRVSAYVYSLPQFDSWPERLDLIYNIIVLVSCSCVRGDVSRKLATCRGILASAFHREGEKMERGCERRRN